MEFGSSKGAGVESMSFLLADPVLSTFPLTRSASLAAGRFAQKNLSIVLDTHAPGEQDDGEVPQFGARLPLASPNAVSLKTSSASSAKKGRTYSVPFYSLARGATLLSDVQVPHTRDASGSRPY